MIKLSVNPFTARVLDGDSEVTLTFESVDEILRCDHSNESSLPVLSHNAICFSKFHKVKCGNLLLVKFGSERVKETKWTGLLARTRALFLKTL